MKENFNWKLLRMSSRGENVVFRDMGKSDGVFTPRKRVVWSSGKGLKRELFSRSKSVFSTSVNAQSCNKLGFCFNID